MKRTFLLIITFLFIFCSSAKSQDVDVCGLVLGNVYSKTQVVAVLGEPDSIYPATPDYGTWCKWCKFGKNELVFQSESDGELDEFYVVDSKYKVLTGLPNGGLRVGDKFTDETLEMVIKYLGIKKNKLGNSQEFRADSNGCFFEVGDYAYFGISLDTEGRIRSLSAQTRD